MRGVVVLLSLLVGSTAWAEAPGADPYEACLAQRHEIYEHAIANDDVATRGRMLAHMPMCQPGMAAEPAGDAVAEADAIAVATLTQYQRDRRWTIGIEPFAVRKKTVLLEVGYMVAPHLGVTVHGGVGRTEYIGIGDTYQYFYLDLIDDADLLAFTEKQIGARASYYLFDPKQGVHVGTNVTYQNFGDPQNPGPSNPWRTIEGFEASVFAGWKMITKEGLTMELQVGPALLMMKTTHDELRRTKAMIPPGWQRVEGMHWYTSFVGGYSF